MKKSYEDLMKQSEESRQDLGSKTILQQYLLTMKKQNLSLDHVIALTSDFLLAGIDTVRLIKLLELLFNETFYTI